MADVVMKLYAVLIDVILPNLNRIQANQAEQKTQTGRMNENIGEIRAEMQLRFAELRAELATTQIQLEAALMQLRESEDACTAAAIGVTPNSMVHSSNFQAAPAFPS